MNFLNWLRDDLRTGLRLVPEACRARHAAWLRAKQCAGGGFANRRGAPDLYYTAFALRGLSALEALTPDIARACGAFLREQFQAPVHERIRQPHGCFSDAVMSVSWWDSLALCEELSGPLLSDAERADARTTTHTRLETLYRTDSADGDPAAAGNPRGGWSKGDADAARSLYHTFLGICVYLRMNHPVPHAAELAAGIVGLQQPGGGFLENIHSRRPGTNGCAAAIGAALALGLDLNLKDHAGFLRDMISPEGGLFATPAAPIADLLSTYTGLFSLRLMEALDPALLAGALKYARERETPEGGYTGFALESVTDCEYTLYGLGVESIVHAEARRMGLW